MLGTEPDFDLRPPAAPCYKVALCGGRGFEYVLQVALPFGLLSSGFNPSSLPEKGHMWGQPQTQNSVP
ncbi:hypothetical protein M8J76_000528 [Diaphorina citri]|nr:hypothetical protein M8J76_000528 [Diaphorina citri]